MNIDGETYLHGEKVSAFSIKNLLWGFSDSPFIARNCANSVCTESLFRIIEPTKNTQKAQTIEKIADISGKLRPAQISEGINSTGYRPPADGGFIAPIYEDDNALYCTGNAKVIPKPIKYTFFQIDDGDYAALQSEELVLEVKQMRDFISDDVWDRFVSNDTLSLEDAPRGVLTIVSPAGNFTSDCEEIDTKIWEFFQSLN